jgi:N-acetylglucosaminyldiphosphoundecaprenol N-acetyl-beta-D-mannosaminyltransferase
MTLGIPVHSISMAETLSLIEKFVEERRPRYLVTANVHFAALAQTDVELHRILCEADAVLCDGTPLLWASRWLGGRIEERVAGSDLLPSLLDLASRKGYRLFFLGSTEETLEVAKRNCELRYPGIRVCGTHSPAYRDFLSLDHETMKRQIRAAEPDILLVAMGCPKQEKFIAMHSRELGVPCSIGVGASIDFLAGRFDRAPKWMKRTGTEWLFRMMHEPSRLFPRYSQDLRFYFPTLAAQLLRNRRRSDRAEKGTGLVEIEGAVACTWRGQVDASAVLRGDLELPALRRPARGIVVQLEEVAAIDAVGLGALVQAWKSCREQGGHLLLFRPSKAVLRAMQMFRLERVLRIVHTVREAERVLALRPGAASLTPAYEGRLGALRIAVEGELTALGVAQSRAAILDAWQAHPSAALLELDLAEVFALDSAGLGALLEVAEAVRERPGGRFAIRSASANVRSVMAKGAGAPSEPLGERAPPLHPSR